MTRIEWLESKLKSDREVLKFLEHHCVRENDDGAASCVCDGCKLDSKPEACLYYCKGAWELAHYLFHELTEEEELQ